jgi:uncharacterized protein (TIGR04255 family)
VASESLDIPTTKNFPVVESVLSVQFEPLPSIHAAHLGLLWNEFREVFPITEERPPLDQVIEQFPEIPSGRAGLKFQTLEKLPIPRLWFTNAQGDEMIQVQIDRFIKNWRKEGEGAPYPRYRKTIRPNFDRDYQTFKTFLEKNRLGSPSVNQCEITYVNQIVADGTWERFSDLEKIFTFWNPPGANPPGDAEDLRMHTSFIIPGEGDKPIGRLHVDVQPAVRNKDNRPMYVMNLTARGQMGDGVDFFDIGHDWIVQAFKNLTHKNFHD